MRQVKVIEEAVVVIAQSEHLMPFHTAPLPILVPLHFRSGLNEELHLHLFKFAHAENELPRNNLISECLANLRNTKWNLHAACLLDVKEVHKNSLSRFRSQVNLIGLFSERSDFCGEHQIELTHVGPVPRAGYRIRYFKIDDELLKTGHVRTSHRGFQPCVGVVDSFPILQYPWIRVFELFSVECRAEFF